MIQWKINYDKRNKTFYTKSLPWQKSWCKWIESLSLFHDSPLTFCFLWFFFSFRLMFIWLSCLSSWWNTLKYNQQMAASEAERTVTHTASSSILQASTAVRAPNCPAGHRALQATTAVWDPNCSADHRALQATGARAVRAVIIILLPPCTFTSRRQIWNYRWNELETRFEPQY